MKKICAFLGYCERESEKNKLNTDKNALEHIFRKKLDFSNGMSSFSSCAIICVLVCILGPCT